MNGTDEWTSHEQMVVIICNCAHTFTGPYWLSQRSHALCVSCHFFCIALSPARQKCVYCTNIFKYALLFYMASGCKAFNKTVFFSLSLARFVHLFRVYLCGACLFAAIRRHFLLTAFGRVRVRANL